MKAGDLFAGAAPLPTLEATRVVLRGPGGAQRGVEEDEAEHDQALRDQAQGGRLPKPLRCRRINPRTHLRKSEDATKGRIYALGCRFGTLDASPSRPGSLAGGCRASPPA